MLLRRQDVVERVPKLVVAHLLQEPELVCFDDRRAGLAHPLVERRDLLDQRVPASGQPLQLRLNWREVRLRRHRWGRRRVGLVVNVDSVLAGQAGQAGGPALAHCADPPTAAATVDLQKDRGREAGETRRGERELLVALHQDRQVIELAVAVRRDDDALDARWNETQIQTQCLFRERDAAARVARSVVENKISVSPDLAPVVEQQGDEVDLCLPRLLQAHVHGAGGDGDVLAGCQVHALCHCPSTR